MINSATLLPVIAANQRRCDNCYKIFEDFGVLTKTLLTTNSNISNISVSLASDLIEISFCKRTVAMALTTKISTGNSYLNATVNLFYKKIDFARTASYLPLTPTSTFDFDQVGITNLKMPDSPFDQIALGDDVQVMTLLLNVLDNLLLQ